MTAQRVLIQGIPLRSFPDNSAGKKSAYNAGDPGLILGLGRSFVRIDRIPSLVVQLVKNPPAMWETWVQSLGWEDTLEKGKATCSSILAWRFPGTV